MKVILNPDSDYVAEVKQKIKENSGYCPCATTKSKNTKCMCKEFREQASGMCSCGLYIKVKEEE